jgi:hypothetical protein
MTAVVGILNKTAIALAADSAVTVSGENGSKIFNTANKIFKLSKYHPIGIAIYSSADLLGTPWEIIIKSYREQLEKTCFDTVRDYQNDFLKYLKENPYYVSDLAKSKAIKGWLYRFIKNDLAQFKFDEDILDELDDEQKSKFIAFLTSKVPEYIENIGNLGKNEGLSALSDNDLDHFLQSVGLDEIFDHFEINEAPLRESYVSLITSYLKSDAYFEKSTGLIFAGYGKKQFFPAISSVTVGEVVADHVRFNHEESQVIDESNDSIIQPYAQTDVIETIISGVSPEISKWYGENIKDFLHRYTGAIIDLLDVDDPKFNEVKEKLRNVDIDNLVEIFENSADTAKKKISIFPIRKTVSILSKEDLGEMAESLIHMTYLKRRMMSDEESVGGPVDVAIISKTDGFIWIKRKYYFKPDLNPHFFHIYYKND